MGHLLPKPPLGARPADSPVSESLMTELVADSYAMHTPLDRTDLVMDALSAFWGELLQQRRSGAPEPEHIIARKNAMEFFAPCRRSGKAELGQEHKVRSPEEEAVCLVLRAAFSGGAPQLLEQLDPSKGSKR
jgi:hypothetical protein